MKKCFAICCLLLCAGFIWAQDDTSAQRPLALAVRPSAEQRKLFKQRNKEIRRLTKQYRRASEEEKPSIKKQLAQLVSTATDEGLAWTKERIAAEKANLDIWEQKLAQQEEKLEEIKARRVDEILSGEAERRYKLARKRWKKEMKAVRKSMK
ncbi:MAG: hypothetical protein IKN49_04070 [Elusimicrobiaceae bacterium]|nr:hypothetical protein [Elusimicrobiaceae bacterium]